MFVGSMDETKIWKLKANILSFPRVQLSCAIQNCNLVWHGTDTTPLIFSWNQRGKTPLCSPRPLGKIDSVVMETSPQPNTSPSDAYWKIEVCENRTVSVRCSYSGLLLNPAQVLCLAISDSRSILQSHSCRRTPGPRCGRGSETIYMPHKDTKNHAICSLVCNHWMPYERLSQK
jgi:hypothetical protein